MPRRRPKNGRWDNPVSLLQAARFEQRWEQWEVCLRMRQECPGHRPGVRCHIGPSKVSEYEHGHRPPSMKHAIALARVYGKTIEQLGLERRHDMPGGDKANGAENSSGTNQATAGYAYPNRGDDSPEGGTPRGRADDDLLLVALLRVLLGEGGSDQMRRDQFVKGMGAAAGGAFIDPFVLMSRQAQDEINYTKVSKEQVQRLTGATYEHARNYYVLTHEGRVQRLLWDWMTAQRLLELPATLSQRVELTNDYARLSGILAFYAFDQGHYVRARSLLETAQEAARESGDVDLLGWLYDRQCEVADWDRDRDNAGPREIVALTTRGLREIGSNETLTTARLHTRAASGYAGLGDHRAATTHIDAAARILGSAVGGCWPSGKDMPRGFTYAEDLYTFAVGKVYARLGSYQEAVPYCRRTVDLQNELGVSTQTAGITAQNRLTLGISLLHVGEMDGAVQTVTSALEEYRGVSTFALMVRAREFEQDLISVDSGGTYAREFSEFLASRST